MDPDEFACGPQDDTFVHIFHVTANWLQTPRTSTCLCGEVTWGEMDDLRTLTKMWEATA